MPGPETRGGGGSRHKYKKEPGVENSDDEESLDTFCDEVRMKSKSCSASDNPQVKVSSPLSSASPSPSKKPLASPKVDRGQIKQFCFHKHYHYIFRQKSENRPSVLEENWPAMMKSR